MNRQEIKEFLNKHSEEEIIEYIFTLESDLLKTQRGSIFPFSAALQCK